MTQPPRLGLLFNGTWSSWVLASSDKYRPFLELVYVHDLDDRRIAHLTALAVPFNAPMARLAERRGVFDRLLARGGKLFFEGNSAPTWFDGVCWEDRPVDNSWWLTDPQHPKIVTTDAEHPIYVGLKPRHVAWHHHGVYTSIPATARIIQRTLNGEIVTWETGAFGGTMLVTTMDPIIEHAIQQIRHLDNYFDRLLLWLTGRAPTGAFVLNAATYGRLGEPAPPVA